MTKKAHYPAAMMKAEDAPTDPAAGYELVRNLIFDQVHKFHFQFGGEFDELVGEANMAFVKGHAQCVAGVRPSGKPLGTTYASEVRRWVWYELFDAMRTRVRRKTAAPHEAIGERDFAAPVPPDFDVAEWAADLGPDARVAADLVLNPPEPILRTAEAKGGTPRNYRSTVRAYLTTEGWEPGRINAAFDEIRKALG